MKVGILYNLVDHIERGFEKDIISDNEIVETVKRVQEALENIHEVVPARVRPELFSILGKTSFDIVFNLCEGLDGNVKGEAWIPAFLDIIGVPYTGSDSFTLALCLDKGKTKDILVANNIPTPRYKIFTSASQEISADLKFPLIVKPVHEDASVGISPDSVVNDESQLMQRVGHILDSYRQPALVEEYIEGRELNVAIIGNGEDIIVFPISEILFDCDDDTARIIDYEAKWINDSEMYGRTKGVCPASLPDDLERKIKKYAIKAYILMGCRDYARIDFRLRDDTPYVLEVNPNPGINVDSGFFRSAEALGLSYGKLIKNILNTAIERTGVVIQNRKRIVKESVIWSKKIFKPVRMEHINIILKWFNDPDVSRHMDDSDVLLTEEDLIEGIFVRTTDDVNFVIYDENRRKEIGFCSIYNINRSVDSGEISFLIGEEDFRNRGHGKDIIRFLCNFGIEELGLNSLLAVCSILNEPALKVFDQTGFKRIGIRSQQVNFYGEKIDEVLFEMLKDNYMQKTSYQVGLSSSKEVM